MKSRQVHNWFGDITSSPAIVVDTQPYDAGQGWAVLVAEKTEANEIGTFTSRSLAPGRGDTP